MNNFSSRIQNNYNYNPSINIPSDKIKPVKCFNSKLYRQSSGKAMIHCISALPEANQRCKQQLRINYLKGVIQKKVANDKYKHLLNIQSPANTQQSFYKQSLVPSQYLQPQRIIGMSNGNTIKENHAVTMQAQMGVQNNPSINYFNMSPGSNTINKNMQVNPLIGGVSRNQGNSNFISVNPLQNYNQTNNQQANQISYSPNMMNQINNFQNLPTLQRGNTFGPTNPLSNNTNNPFSNALKPGVFQQQNNIVQPNSGNNSFVSSQTNPSSMNQTNFITNQSSLNPFQSIKNSSFTPQNGNQNPFNGFGQPASSLSNTNTATNNMIGQQTQGNLMQNQTNPLFNQNKNLVQGTYGSQNQAANQNQFYPNLNIQQQTNLGNGQLNQANLSSQTAKYAGKYPMLYKMRQQQLKKIKDSNINQNYFTIQSLNKHIKDFEQNKYNIWNQLTLNRQEAGQNNQQGRRYITHVLKRMIDQKMIDQKVLKDSISTLYKFIYGEGVFNQLFNEYKNRSSVKSLNGVKGNPFFDFLQDQPKNIRMDDIMGKSTDQTNFSVRGRFKSLQNFDEKMLSQKNQIKHNLQNSFQEQQQQRQFQVRFVPHKKKESQLSYSAKQLQRIGYFIKQDRYFTFKTIMVQPDELPKPSDYEISPSVSLLSKMMKHQIRSVPHVRIQNQWGYAQFMAPISLLKKNIKQCITINKRQAFIHDQEWAIRVCRVTFKKFQDFSEMGEQDRRQMERQIKKWCKEAQIELLQINQAEGKVVVEF